MVEMVISTGALCVRPSVAALADATPAVPCADETPGLPVLRGYQAMSPHFVLRTPYFFPH